MAGHRASAVLDLIRLAGMRSKLHHLGLNKNGSPKHPLYIATSTQPQRFTASLEQKQ